MRMLASNGIAEGQAMYDGMMHAVDWVPTLCAIAGCDATPKTKGITLDGVNQLAAITSNSSSPRSRVILDIENPEHTRWPNIGSGVLRIGKYKLHVGKCAP